MLSSSGGGKREYTAGERTAEAAAIVYKVIGALQKNDRVFKPYEPVFAVVQVQLVYLYLIVLIGRKLLYVSVFDTFCFSFI